MSNSLSTIIASPDAAARRSCQPYMVAPRYDFRTQLRNHLLGAGLSKIRTKIRLRPLASRTPPPDFLQGHADRALSILKVVPQLDLDPRRYPKGRQRDAT